VKYFLLLIPQVCYLLLLSKSDSDIFTIYYLLYVRTFVFIIIRKKNMLIKINIYLSNIFILCYAYRQCSLMLCNYKVSLKERTVRDTEFRA
jgi:hypothetical protein